MKKLDRSSKVFYAGCVVALFGAFWRPLVPSSIVAGAGVAMMAGSLVYDFVHSRKHR